MLIAVTGSPASHLYPPLALQPVCTCQNLLPRTTVPNGWQLLLRALLNGPLPLKCHFHLATVCLGALLRVFGA